MSVRADRGRMPSSVTSETGRFDRFAEAASGVVSRAWFFTACLLMVVVWAPTYPLFGNVNTWQLLINSATTIVTFLLVALLQNAQRRSDQATQHKLNAIAAALGEAMYEDPAESDTQSAARVADARAELRAAVGLEERESA